MSGFSLASHLAPRISDRDASFARIFTAGALPAGTTYNGNAGLGSRIDATGVIVASVANVARTSYSATAIGTLLGVLNEPAATNLLLNAALNGTALTTQNVAVTVQAYTLSFYGTGSVALSGAAVATLAGAGAYPARASLTFTPAAGTLTLTVTGSVQYAQLEVASVASTFIPTGAAAVTRTADAFTLALPAGTNSLLFTFDDNSTQRLTAAPGNYAVPTNLTRVRIKRIDT